MRRLLLLLLIPLVMAAVPPQGTSKLVIHCGKDFTVYYILSGNDLTFFYIPEENADVVRAFYYYYKLGGVADKLNFVSDATVTSLRSLASAMDDYHLQLLQAKSLLNRYHQNLDLRELNDTSSSLKLSLNAMAGETESLERNIQNFLQDPYCNPVIDYNVLNDMEGVYSLAVRLLNESQQLKTKLSTEGNVDLSLVNAVSKLITPPYDRPSMDELLSKARTDRDTLSMIFNPSQEDILHMLSISENYRNYSDLMEVMNSTITTKLGTFSGLEPAITFIQSNADRLKKKDEISTLQNLYTQFNSLKNKGDYFSALKVAQRMKNLAVDILNAGFEEEQSQKGGMNNYYLALIFILLGLLIVGIVYKHIRRGGSEDEVDLDSDDLDSDELL